MEEHKQYHKSWEIADDLGDSEYTIKGVNPFLHIQIHFIVEKQLSMITQWRVRKVAKRLRNLGMARHEVIHAIGGAVANQIYNILKYNLPFDKKGISKI